MTPCYTTSWDLTGSHGGLGGRQSEPFLLHPVDLPLVDGPLIGAPAVHTQLRGWLEMLRGGGPKVVSDDIGDPDSNKATRPVDDDADVDDAEVRPAAGPAADPAQPVGAGRATGTPPA